MTVLRRNCGRCHICGTVLKLCLDGEEWCPECGAYRRYRSHGWAAGLQSSDELGPCPGWDKQAVSMETDSVVDPR